MEQIAAVPLSYRNAAPPPVNYTPEGEWILFVIGTIVSILFGIYLILAR